MKFQRPEIESSGLFHAVKGRTRARIFRPTPRNLALLAARLRQGELVAVPTETVYGLAANALDAKACAKIFRAKGRPTKDPLIVHLGAVEQVNVVAVPNAAADRLIKAFWPGPLTLILPKRDVVPEIVTAGRNSVAIRMPRHPVFRRLAKITSLPLAAPSANPFGYISPTTAKHVAANLGAKIGYILDGGPAEIGLESTIVDLRDPARPKLLRPGAISAAELSVALGRTVAQGRRHQPDTEAQLAPGQMLRHYSPRTPVQLHETAMSPENPREAYVFMSRPRHSNRSNIYWLDTHGSLRGAARRLFATLRQLDAKHYRRIHVQRAFGGPLADAINDRLERAAAR